jgi:glyoxylase-like metal-dependent hydrolase (beta-lactamase superfamily II)
MKFVMKAVVVLAIAGALGLAMRASTFAQSAAVDKPPAPAVLDTFHVGGNVHLIVGAGGNIAVQVGDEGVLVVDTGLAATTDRVLATIKTLSRQPIRWIINTHFHPDHTGGNEALAKAGSKTNGGPAEIIAHERVLTRMSAPAGKQPPTAAAAWPTDTYVPEEKDIYFNGEAVMVYHEPMAHTDGDSIVFFRKSDVVVAGDTFVTTSYPFIDRANGGSVHSTGSSTSRCPPTNRKAGRSSFPDTAGSATRPTCSSTATW